MSEFTYEDSTGKEFTAKDTADNRVAVKNQGYTISEGIGKTIAEGARGIEETIGEHAITKYNPILIPERYIMKGIASLGGAKTNEEIKAEDKIVYSDSDGKEYTAKNTSENIKSLKEQGYKVQDPTTEGTRGVTSAYLEQVGNQYGFGIPHMLDNPEEKARHEALATNNPVSNVIGGTMGIAASLATPGLNMAKLGQLAERGVARAAGAAGIEGASIVGKVGLEVAKHAASGLVYSGPHAIATATIEKNPTKAIEELLIGLTIGGLFGIGSASLQKFISPAAEKAVAWQESKLADLAKNAQHEALQSGEATVKKVTESIPKTAEEKAAEIKSMFSNVDKTIDEHLSMGEKSGIVPGTVAGFDYLKVAAEIDKAHSAAGGEGASKLANEISAFGDTQGREAEASIPFSKLGEMESYLKASKLLTPEAAKVINDEVLESIRRANLLNEALPNIIKTQENAEKVVQSVGEVAKHGFGHALAKAAGYIGVSGALHAVFPGAGLITSLGVARAGEYAGEKLLGTWIQRSGTQLGPKLQRWAENTQIPSMLIIDANAMNKAKIASIPNLLQEFATRDATSKESFDATKKVLGPEANGRNAEQRFDTLSKNIVDSHSNPVATQAHLRELIQPIAEAHSAIGEIMMENAQKKMEYIYSILPKNPNVAPQPFAKNEKWKPTPQQLNDFNKQLAVADDPYHVINELKAGTLTSKQVATLAYLNPEILQSMRDEITKLAFSGKAPNLSYQQKLNMSILMGESMVKTLDYIQPLQSAYSADSMQQQTLHNIGGAKPHKGGHHINAENLPASEATPAQRISNPASE